MYNNLLAKDKEWDAREAVVETGKKLLETKLVAGSWGNISCRINDDKIAITPSGRRYSNLKMQDVVVINYEGKPIESSLIPSSESLLHVAIYKNYPEAKAIIHTHSVYASAFAAMRKNIPSLVEDIMQICGGEVVCADYAMAGTQELADNTVKALGGRKACLLANHGAVCWGKTLEEALNIAEILEKAAQIAIICNGQGVPITADDVDELHRFYNEHYSKRQMGLE